ncbi:NAD(P)/FAD-dependent oxidoreductase [Halanaeroarchaeum sulfurireducens]|uniref:FAD-dependent pyridine nucleotide-disulfide oxidoreductase n=1 Tax=Halanaeroarchaeum sulfurireducens TaxID=1604004 RepID=A0A0N9N7I2_9EURY|nr:FAD/NAD(P)-binding oxidoreductase [Halanaeroarchaeum sulfurireducens]ALG83008.1 FAD-dependent pyridine nucleotide-disulfide oxidoreductase [Halanaeroarchaeum sulfurireducens]
MTEEIVIIGGGVGGTVTANRLVDHLEHEVKADEVRVTIVTDDPYHVYKPIYLYVPFGKKEAEDAKRPLADVVDRHVDLVYDHVTEIDTDGQSLSLQDGNEMDYDYLVVSTGAIPDPESTPGLGPDQDGHHFYGPDAAEELREALANLEEGRLVLSVIGTPHVCPAAPVEFAFMAHSWLQKRGLREDVDVSYTYPINRLHGVRPVADWMTPRFEDRGIDTETFFNVESVDSDEQVIETIEGKELDYDLMVGIPEFKPSPLIEESGLGAEWMEVNKDTLESEHAENVFGIGDVSNLPTSKAGSVAHYASGVVVDRIASYIRGQTPTGHFEGDTVCFIEAGMNEGTHITFDYENDPVVRDETEFIHWAKLSYNEAYWLTARGLL